MEVPKNCVHITSRPNQTFAIVDLHDDSISNYLLSQLFYLENVQNVFDLRAITWSPHDLRVGPKLTNGDRKRRSRSRAKKREKQRLASESRSPGGLNHHPNHAHVSRETQKNDFTRSRMSSHGNQAQGFPVVSQDSKHSHGSGQSSESDEDFMDAVSSQPSATKVFSNSTVSSEGSFHRLDRPGPSRDSRPAGLQARGVTRLKEEHGLDSVGRALSDQQIPAQEGTRNTTTSTTGQSCDGWFVGCLTSQQQASVSQGRICLDNFTCCHTEIEAADQTFYLTQSQYTDTGLTSPSADPMTPGA